MCKHRPSHERNTSRCRVKEKRVALVTGTLRAAKDLESTSSSPKVTGPEACSAARVPASKLELEKLVDSMVEQQHPGDRLSLVP